MRDIDIIMPVKDSIEMTTKAIKAIVGNGYTLTVFNDNSTIENTQTLEHLAKELAFELINISEITNHPSPNYLTVLRLSQQRAISRGHDLLIIESDVIIKPDTISTLQHIAQSSVKAGLVAAITENEAGEINFPYQYLNYFWHRNHNNQTSPEATTKRLSFCCTLLTLDFLNAFDFNDLDPSKNWYDVTISHKSLELGYKNYIQRSCRVAHYPHSSRPWKQLKYTNPLRYYWKKITQHKDRI